MEKNTQTVVAGEIVTKAWSLQEVRKVMMVGVLLTTIEEELGSKAGEGLYELLRGCIMETFEEHNPNAWKSYDDDGSSTEWEFYHDHTMALLTALAKMNVTDEIDPLKPIVFRLEWSIDDHVMIELRWRSSPPGGEWVHVTG